MTIKKLNKIIKPNLTKVKVDPWFTISYTKLWGLSSNFPKVKFHHLDAKLDLLFPSETSINPFIPVQELAIPGYLPLIVKHHHHGRDPKTEDLDHSYINFHVALIHSTAFIFILYHTQERTVMFNPIAETIDNVLTKYLSASFQICGDSNIHHKM